MDAFTLMMMKRNNNNNKMAFANHNIVCMLAAREFLKLKDIYVSSEILRINRHLTSP